MRTVKANSNKGVQGEQNVAAPMQQVRSSEKKQKAEDSPRRRRGHRGTYPRFTIPVISVPQAWQALKSSKSYKQEEEGNRRKSPPEAVSRQHQSGCKDTNAKPFAAKCHRIPERAAHRAPFKSPSLLMAVRTRRRDIAIDMHISFLYSWRSVKCVLVRNSRGCDAPVRSA